jgi:transposase
MESTGVYWIRLFQILEQRKIDVRLVNAHHVKNVPGRKTDVADCQWIQHLHACGLLRGSFRPDDEICAIRSLWRQRDNLIELATIHLQHMQKALDQMNVKLHHVISDLAGATGLAIVDAILAGERDPGKLAELRDWRIRASKETIMKSLVGDYREEHIFTLGQSLKCYRQYQNMIQEVDHRVKGMMQQLPSKVADGQKPPKEKNPRKTPWRNEPPQLRDDLYRAFGVDLTQVPGINTLAAQMLLSEVGPDYPVSRRQRSSVHGFGFVQIRRSAAGRCFLREPDPRKTAQLSRYEWVPKVCTTARTSLATISAE